MNLKIAGLVNDSIVDGPGIRYTVFVQGCPHHCEGCHNLQTWDFDGGRIETTDEVFEKITKNPLLDGVTFSGGEPFCQCHALAELGDKILAFDGFKLNLMAYTGYEFEYLVKHANAENGYMELLSRLDYLVDGRFILAKKSYELKFMGSSNQRFIDVKKSLEQGSVVLAHDPWDNIEIKLI
jgi:anaerobic ribonucleoside-triphosphate reductase activating protein